MIQVHNILLSLVAYASYGVIPFNVVMFVLAYHAVHEENQISTDAWLGLCVTGFSVTSASLSVMVSNAFWPVKMMCDKVDQALYDIRYSPPQARKSISRGGFVTYLGSDPEPPMGRNLNEGPEFRFWVFARHSLQAYIAGCFIVYLVLMTDMLWIRAAADSTTRDSIQHGGVYNNRLYSYVGKLMDNFFQLIYLLFFGTFMFVVRLATESTQ